MTVKWVGFDFDGTFYEFDAVRKFNQELTANYYEAGRKMEYSEKQLDQFKHSISEEYVRLSALAHKMTPKSLLERGAKKGVARTVNKMARDYNMYIITNAVLPSVETGLDALGLQRTNFEFIIAHGEVYKIENGRSSWVAHTKLKPDTHPFNYSAEYSRKHSGVPAAQHVFIGDSETHDIEPARNAGMRAIRAYKKSRYAGVPWIRTFSDLPQKIRKL